MPTFNPTYPYPSVPTQEYHQEPYYNGYRYYTYTFSRFNVPNKKVAVEPFPETAKAEVKNGVLQPMNAAALTPLKVVYGGGAYWTGQTVYVRSKLRQTTTYGKEVFEVDGKKFILIPEDEVLLVDNHLEVVNGVLKIYNNEPASTP